MSTHGYDLEGEAEAEPLAEPDEELDDLLYDVQQASSRGFYTPIWPEES